MSDYLAPDFEPFLRGYSVHELESAAHTVVGLRPDLSIGYRNSAWARFAADNGAPDLVHGDLTPITEAFSEPVRAFYEALFRGVQESGEPADHDYECSSPELFRGFRLRVLPLPGGGLLLLHHLTVEEPVNREVLGASSSRYLDPLTGTITQCCHCRRTRRAEEQGTWDWVPAYLDRENPQISHGLCPPCFRHYHANAARKWDAQRGS